MEDSKLDVEVSETTDGGLLGVNGILDCMVLSFEDGVAGIGGILCKGVVTVCRRSSVGSVGCGSVGVEEGRRENSWLRLLSLLEVEPNLPLARAGARDPRRAGFHSRNSKISPGHVEAKLDCYAVPTLLDPVLKGERQFRTCRWCSFWGPMIPENILILMSLSAFNWRMRC